MQYYAHFAHLNSVPCGADYSEDLHRFIQSLEVTVGTGVARMVQVVQLPQAAESMGRQNEYHKWESLFSAPHTF
jgi:hypothetical protein